MLKTLKIKDFMGLPDATVNFVPGITVILGENGTGKSSLLKLAYTLTSVLAKPQTKKHGNLSEELSEKLIGVFRPEDLGRLARRRPGRTTAEIEAVWDKPKASLKMSLSSGNADRLVVQEEPNLRLPQEPAFLPTRELLTLYPNFLATYDKYYLEYEETYRDLCALLGGLVPKGPTEKKAAALLKPLEKAMGGKIVLDANGRFYLQSQGLGKIEMPLVAEGLRKLATIARLIVTGTLLDKGFLFWDEPETNLNAKLIREVANTCHVLAQNGVQVIVATHSLMFMRELELLQAQAKQRDQVKLQVVGLAYRDKELILQEGKTFTDIDTIVALDEEIHQAEAYMRDT
ncbi:MAG: AAA family ATPase [Fibrobacteres bacterium]|nr:AAA family ATPase [Fibrobacterota bacterium]